MGKSKEDIAEVLQEKFEAIGLKTSKETAWKAFKASIDAVVDTCLSDEEGLSVSLAGVGKFEILKAAPRQSKVGVVAFIPRLRFRPSSKINTLLEERMGVTPDPEKLAAVKAKLIASGAIHSNLPAREKKAEAPAKKAAAPAAPAKKAAAPAKKAAAPAGKKGAGSFEDEF